MKWPIDRKYGLGLDDVGPLPESRVDTTPIRVRNQKGQVSAEEWAEYIREWHRNNPGRNKLHQSKFRQTNPTRWAQLNLRYARKWRAKVAGAKKEEFCVETRGVWQPPP